MKTEDYQNEAIDNSEQYANCCSTEENDNHEHEHEHSHNSVFIPSLLSFALLSFALYLDYILKPEWFSPTLRLILYLLAYLPVGLPVLKDAVKHIFKGDIFSEFFLMGLATLGAFAIKEYPEAVAVMLFYSVGEAFQSLAVKRAKNNIKALIDQRPDQVSILTNNSFEIIKAKDAKIGQIIALKPGEKVALDGELLSETAAFNTSALTGESKPDTKKKGESVYAGMINLNTPAQIKVNTLYNDSKLSKILDLVQNANKHKAPTELFIRKFAKFYTPFVVFLAIGICLVPYFYSQNYDFSEWLYRALVFLVISCPCALVISIPLGYFGGIGAASKNGILIKGGQSLDILANIQNVVMDKTGTLTEGVFEVQKIHLEPGFQENKILSWVNEIEKFSTHPVASAIHNYVGKSDNSVTISKIEEKAGLGLKGSVEGGSLLVGNFKLLDKFEIPYPANVSEIVETVIAIAYKNQFVGYITIADRIKEEAPKAIKKLHDLKVSATMLSGDKDSIVQKVAKELGIENAFGDLLPEDKVDRVKQIKARKGSVAFVGDGLNDAPVIAISNVGIAMGGLGADATIETADVVIQDDNPYKIPVSIEIGKKTKQIVYQNVFFAFAVKAIVLLLGANGLANMWEAVFADVGVALLAILNAIRIQRMTWN